MSMNGAYFNGLDADGQQGALANIPGSVTTDYILFSLNVAGVNAAGQPSADINYGWALDRVLARDGQVTPDTAKILTPIVQAGVAKGKCQRVWLALGAAVNPRNPDATSPFKTIQTILDAGGTLKSTLLENFTALAQTFKNVAGVKEVGFDMDYEEDYQHIASRVANVTIALYDKLKCPFTFCPYQGLVPWEQSPWITALQQVYSEKKTQPVVGFNLQTYAGGSGNDPTKWADAIKAATETAVADPAAFVWPIVSCDRFAGPVTPANELAQKLKDWKSKGASLWATQPPEQPAADLKAYSAAIAQGIA